MTETKIEKDILENTDTDSAKDTMVNSKTGIYHDRDFFRKVKSFLSEIEPGTHCILAIDIEHFKIFNNRLFIFKINTFFIFYPFFTI